MLVSFFESIKYVGHLAPVAFLRIFLGYHFFNSALERMNGGFLDEPRLAAVISEWLPRSQGAEWYVYLLENWVIPRWQLFAYLITYCEFIVGVSFIIGFCVRPIALLGILICVNFIYGMGGDFVLNQVFIAIFITIAWLGGGRSVGFDYFFYKRQRGIWW
ncbi:MAG: DoxX family protein [Bdellovibrionales bacterium]|nr:DoxX family protein [Bdellovibrionales bacterium]